MSIRASDVTQLPVDPDGAEIVVFGGSFDPPTRAHVELSSAARDEVCPRGWLLFVPAGRSPHKERGPFAGDADRVSMLGIACSSVPRVGVWTDEIDRAGAPGAASYMVETLRRLLVVAPGSPLRLLIGADQALAFHRWRDAGTILGIAPPIVMLRRPAESVDVVMSSLRGSGAWSEEELGVWSRGIAPIQTELASATEAREILGEISRGEQSGDDMRRIAAIMDERVLAYIRDTGLYADVEG